MIGVADAVKPASKAALDALKALGLDVILLTGDSRTNADRIAAQVGLDDAHVVSGLAPQSWKPNCAACKQTALPP